MLINIFSKNKRVPEIELMKAFAVVSMIFVHTAEIVVEGNHIYIYPVEGVIFLSLVSFFGGIPSAGVFMFSMGWGASFSKTATYKTCLNRVVPLFLLGIVVNFFEQYVPQIITPEIFGKLEENLHTILATDIYFFAALASLYLAVMKFFKNQPVSALIFSAVLLAVCIFIRIFFGIENFSTENIWLDTLIGLFVRENEFSYFPFTVWIFFPIIGYGAAVLYKKSWSLKERLLFSSVTGIIAIVVAEFAMEKFGVIDGVLFANLDITLGNYYAMHPLNLLCSYGIIALEFFVASVVMKITNNYLPNFILNMSKNIVGIYVAQWIILGCMSGWICEISTVSSYIFVALTVLIVSYFSAIIFKEIIERIRG